jgi:hypothetical protein
MDELSTRDLTRLMHEGDKPDGLGVSEFTGNYSGDRIRLPGFTGVDIPDATPQAIEIRANCGTEVWFADKECQWLVFHDEDGDIAIVNIRDMIDSAARIRRAFDDRKDAKAQQEQDKADAAFAAETHGQDAADAVAEPIVATTDVESAAATPTVIDADEFAEATDDDVEFPDPEEVTTN